MPPTSPSVLQSGQSSLISSGVRKLHIDAEGRGDAGVLVILVHALGVHGEADVADLPEPDILAGLFLEGLRRSSTE